MAELRKLAYPHTHCFLFAYATNKRDSLENVEEGWITEVQANFTKEQKMNKPARILVGTKSDLKDEENVDHVTYEEGYEVAKKIKADAFIETSALTRDNVQQLQKMVIQAAKAHKENNWLPFKITDFATKPDDPVVKEQNDAASAKGESEAHGETGKDEEGSTDANKAPNQPDTTNNKPDTTKPPGTTDKDDGSGGSCCAIL
eukprot:TRINITY_DN1277_c0_g1_i2.p1 TRINITY_DN1277_c0_g1~~TRINITY_DN1277_c0_g1_i2.p1  ORF type:complete len:202 (+),score=35.75 TRINITY_DN1277_c0_g1_i2:182-787(+)